ncbi:MAG: Trm112 family protein [Luteimonas sp.]
MDRKLLDILVCPASRQPLALLDKAGLEALNGAIAAGNVARVDGSAQADAVREALVTDDRRTVYRIDDGIPVLLVEEGIATAQVPAFPKPAGARA